MKIKLWRVKHLLASITCAGAALYCAASIYPQGNGFAVVALTIGYASFTLVSLVCLRNHLINKERQESGRFAGPFLDSVAEMWGLKRAYAGWENDASLVRRICKEMADHDMDCKI